MGERGMTIDEVARAVGTTSRNVRAYQTRGLLPPPRVTGRVGYYDEGHLARLRLIAEGQARGFSLAAIGELLRAWQSGKGISDVLGFEEALTAPWSDEPEGRLDADALQAMFPTATISSGVAARAISLGVLVPEGDAFRVPSPRLLQIGAELVALGVPLEAALDVLAALRSDMGRIASVFVDLFNRYVWLPFQEAGMPAGQLSRVTEILRRLRPLASDAVGATLARAMEDAVSRSAVEQVRHVREAAAGDVEASA
jgi:DNA-binding transcriptional MerR regulator